MTIRELGTRRSQRRAVRRRRCRSATTTTCRRARGACSRLPTSCSPRTRAGSAISRTEPICTPRGPVVSYHDQNEAARGADVIARLAAGRARRAGQRRGHAVVQRSRLRRRARRGRRRLRRESRPRALVVARGAERIGPRRSTASPTSASCPAARRPARPSCAGLTDRRRAFVVHEAPRRVARAARRPRGGVSRLGGVRGTRGDEGVRGVPPRDHASAGRGRRGRRTTR